MLRALGRAYDGLLNGLAAAGALILGAIAVLIVGDVVLRTAGIQPPAHTLALTEYGLYYATLLAAPWLVRTGGHVKVEMITAFVSPTAKLWLARLALAICLVACLLMGALAIDVAATDFARGVFDMRSFDMPKGLLTGALAPSFLLMAVEFGRLLVGAAPDGAESETELGM